MGHLPETNYLNAYIYEHTMIIRSNFCIPWYNSLLMLTSGWNITSFLIRCFAENFWLHFWCLAEFGRFFFGFDCNFRDIFRIFFFKTPVSPRPWGVPIECFIDIGAWRGRKLCWKNLPILFGQQGLFRRSLLKIAVSCKCSYVWD